MIKLLKSLVICCVMVLISFNTNAGGYSNEECMKVYREGYVELSQLVKDYNEGYLGKVDFSSIVGLLSTSIGAKRLICGRVENPNNKTCVEGYKKIYKDLRSRINLKAVLAGNQDEISFSKSNDEGGFFSGVSNFFNELKDEASFVVNDSKIFYLDKKCSI